jgi:hypothetical protein
MAPGAGGGEGAKNWERRSNGTPREAELATLSQSQPQQQHDHDISVLDEQAQGYVSKRFY